MNKRMMPNPPPNLVPKFNFAKFKFSYSFHNTIILFAKWPIPRIVPD